MKKNRTDEFVSDYKKAVHTLALPLLVGFGVSTLYAVVDTIFVGGLGPDALAGITFATPVFFFLFAIAMGLGTGFTATISMAIGSKNKKLADNIAEHAILLSVLLGLAVGVFGWFYCKDLFVILGASGNVLNMAVEYFQVIFATLFITFAAVFSRSILSGEGDMKFQMNVMILSSVVNAVLDPVFIYIFGWGIAGAAWATVVANLFAFVLLFEFLLSKKGAYIDLNFADFSLDFSIFKNALIIGIPAMFAQLVMSLGQAFINFMISPFGSVAVAGFGIGNRLDMLMFIPLIAISGVVTTLAGMFYGAKQYHLIVQTVNYAIKLSMIFAIGISVIFYLFAEVFLSVFTNDAMLISIGSDYIRLMVFTYPMVAIGINVGRMLIGIGRPMQGFIITATRVLLVFIPIAIYLTDFMNFGLKGVWYAVIAGSLVSTIIAIILLWRFYHNCPKSLQENPS